jgi:transglutaminase-like putative cysteine protease
MSDKADLRHRPIFFKILNCAVLFFLLLAILVSCSREHLINNKSYLNYTDSTFNQIKKLCINRKDELFSVFDQALTPEQTEALKFLFAYSPLNDLAEFSGDFFLANAKIALRTRQESSWGNSIPVSIFLHYVLPFRINNENLDSFRISYYDEIKSRISGMDAASAALEINHWCHEKVTYQPSDIRTSGPMSTILSARGRCGEESTFTVAALRTAGLPARQVYTPRWAHTDDNHAWVEVWIDNKWYCMGACEPEPVLDLGWFVDPAKRAMLIHTKSFGHATGDENSMIISTRYSEINNLSKYAPTKTILVKVLDKEAKPVSGAIVEYQLYNYAEFYPLTDIPTDLNGISKFETGSGDLMIWARKDSSFNFRKVSVSVIDTIILTLDKIAEGTHDYIYDLGVPPVGSPSASPDKKLLIENSERIKKENQNRQQYMDSWMKPDEAEALAKRNGSDIATVKDLISGSMGNYKSISRFLDNAPSDRKYIAVLLLKQLTDKDLRDTPLWVLTDYLSNLSTAVLKTGDSNSAFFNDYVLNPRVANEILTPYRGYILKNLPDELKKGEKSDPKAIEQYLKSSIKIADEENYYHTPITPAGALSLKVSDSFSRDILFVAICRTLGIPSRLEPATNKPQYWSENKWMDAIFSAESNKQGSKGFIRFTSEERNPMPEYYIHFTLAKLEKGRYNTLDFDYNKKVTDFKNELFLDAGHYMLMTGNRVSDSKILSSQHFFDLNIDEHKTLKIELRKEQDKDLVSGSVNLNFTIPLGGGKSTQLRSLASNGLTIIWLKPESEPSKHVMNDLQLFKAEFDKWGGTFIFLNESTSADKNFSREHYSSLPDNSIFATDQESELLKATLTNCNPSELQYPYLIVANSKGEIIYRSEGYRIGIGEQIIKRVQ